MASVRFYKGDLRSGYFEKHGLCWVDGTPPLQIELACFREKIGRRVDWNLGGATPMWHFKKIAKSLWPEVEEDGWVPFVWNRWADTMLKYSCEENYVAIAGCAGLGKSEFYAIWLIIQFLCDPENTLCITTSKTLHLSKMKMWAKIVKYWMPLEKLGMPGKLIDSVGRIRYMDHIGRATKGDLAGIALIPSEKKQEKEALSSIGIHPRRAIFVADDLTELSEALTDAALGNLSMGCEYFQFAGLANPASHYDSFGKFAAPKDGWNSITVEDEIWKTEHGVCIHFDATTNPRITEGDNRLFWMPAIDDIEEKKKVDGENSAKFWRMIRGFWCPEGVEEYIYSEIEILKNDGDKKAVWLDGEQKMVSFLDPSFTHGGDRTIAYFGKYGKNNFGYDTLEYTDYAEFHEDVTNKEEDRTRQAINWWKQQCLDREVSPYHCGLDETGAGAVFLDDVRLFWSKEVHGIKFGGAATDRPVSANDPTPGHDRYVNRVTEVWYAPKEALRTGQIRGLSPDLIKEMTVRKKTDEKGLLLRVKAQSKYDMKLETGMSPDIGDAGMGLAELCRELFGFNTSRAAREKHPNSRTAKPYKKIFAKFDTYKKYITPNELQLK